MKETEKHVISIDSEMSYRGASRILTRKKRPPAILRLLMNSVESYRQSRKYGWSRPWNKENLINFQSFSLKPTEDRSILDFSKDLLGLLRSVMPVEASTFVHSLFQCEDELMAFIFCHEYDDPSGARYEGATLSLGRKHEKRYRDRIDIIVESEVENGCSQGYTRARVYVDPYRDQDKNPVWARHFSAEQLPAGRRLFECLSDVSWRWASRDDKKWSHWTSEYIEYFGERRWDVPNSFFWSDVRWDKAPQTEIVSNAG